MLPNLKQFLLGLELDQFEGFLVQFDDFADLVTGQILQPIFLGKFLKRLLVGSHIEIAGDCDTDSIAKLVKPDKMCQLDDLRRLCGILHIVES